MPKIDRNIPIPSHHRSRTGLWPLVRQLAVGDSVKVPDGLSNPHTACHHAARKLGIKVAVRKTVGGLRLWRIA